MNFKATMGVKDAMPTKMDISKAMSIMELEELINKCRRSIFLTSNLDLKDMIALKDQLVN